MENKFRSVDMRWFESEYFMMLQISNTSQRIFQSISSSIEIIFLFISSSFPKELAINHYDTRQ